MGEDVNATKALPEYAGRSWHILAGLRRAYPKTRREWAGTSSAAQFGKVNHRTKGADDVPQSVSARTTAPAPSHDMGDPRRYVALASLPVPAREATGHARPPNSALSHRPEWKLVCPTYRVPMESNSCDVWVGL